MNQNKQRNYAQISLILGIIGVVLGCILIGAGAGVAAIIVGAISIKYNDKKARPTAIAGITCGCLSLIIVFAMSMSVKNSDVPVEVTESIEVQNQSIITDVGVTDTEIFGLNTEDGSAVDEETQEVEPQPATTTLEVHYIDVGQGDATLLSSDGHYMLIDAGNNNKGTLVQSYLQSLGIETLDYVIGTHPDADHIGGLDVILYKFDCKTVILPDVKNDTRTYDDVVQTMKSKNYNTTYPAVGDTYTLGGVTFTIVSPNDNYGTNLNDWSVGILVQNGDNRFLFTGDAEEAAEKDILNNGIDISADVYKVSHHGSNTATTDDLLTTINPTYAVISAGENNQYGHPSAEVLNKLRSNGVKVFRTDEQGTIVATSDGTNITWNCSPSDTWKSGEPTGTSDEKESSNGVSGNAATTNDASANDENANGNQSQTYSNSPEKTSSDSVTSNTSNGNDDTGISNTDNSSTDTSNDVIVHVTKTGGKYHSAGCQYLRQSDIEISLSSAKSSGYEPCSKCNPPR